VRYPRAPWRRERERERKKKRERERGRERGSARVLGKFPSSPGTSIDLPAIGVVAAGYQPPSSSSLLHFTCRGGVHFYSRLTPPGTTTGRAIDP